MADTTIAYRVRFTGLDEARARTACEGFVGGNVSGIRVWSSGEGHMLAEFTIPMEDAAALREELEEDDRVAAYSIADWAPSEWST